MVNLTVLQFWDISAPTGKSHEPPATVAYFTLPQGISIDQYLTFLGCTYSFTMCFLLVA